MIPCEKLFLLEQASVILFIVQCFADGRVLRAGRSGDLECVISDEDGG